MTGSNRQARNTASHGTSSTWDVDGFNGTGDPSNDDISAGNAFSRETTITQEVTIRVLPAHLVEALHEPRCKEPEVHILLPPLLQLKSISERFTKLALSSSKKTHGGGLQGLASGPRLELAANMHGELRLGIKTDTLKIQSKWSGLSNPELDPSVVEGGEEGVRAHPSTRMKEMSGEQAWAVVRVEGKDWGRVLGVGRLGGRVVACEFFDAQAAMFKLNESCD
jgi:HUS1 checkpoint protein